MKLAPLIFLLTLISTAQAIVYDLNTLRVVTVETSTGTALFTADFSKSTGTGLIDPFLSIQRNGTEGGYNSDAGNFDTKRLGQYTREIQMKDLATVTYNGVQYYSFLLDVNENNSSSDRFITLDVLKVYTKSSFLTQPTQNLGDLGALKFDLGDTQILYDDANTGSGQGDIAFFLPTNMFAGTQPTDYFYMYQHFTDTQGGFEETKSVQVMPIPETGTILPLAAVLGVIGLCPVVRRLTRKQSVVE